MDNLKLGGYTLEFPEKHRLVVRVGVMRLLLMYAARALGILIIALFIYLLTNPKNTIWGNLILIVLTLLAVAAVLLPENLRFEFRKGQLIRHSTIWGYGLTKKIDFSDTLWIAIKHYSKAGGIMYGAVLWAQTTSGSMELMMYSATDREKLRELAETFVALVHEKTGNKVKLA
jgi:hypothetical protein